MASVPRLVAGSSVELVECRDELVTDILSRVSTRDLLKMSTVSKRWRALILDPDFVHIHCKNCHRESIFCLVDIRMIQGNPPMPKQCQFRSYDLQKGHLSILPFSWEGLDSNVHNWNFELLTASHGLMCFYPRVPMDALLWVYNPVTKCSKKLTMPFKVDTTRTSFAEICYMQNTLKFVMAGHTGSQLRQCTLVFDFHSNSWYEGQLLPYELSYCNPPGAKVFFNGVFYFVSRILSLDAQEFRGIRDVDVEALFSDHFDYLHMIVGYDVNQDQWGFSLFIPSTIGFIYCLTEWEGNLLVCASTSTYECNRKIRNSQDEGDGHFVFWILDTEHKRWIRERELDVPHQIHNRCLIWRVSASGGVFWFTCGYSSVIVYDMKTRCCSTHRLDDAIALQETTYTSFVSFEPNLLSF